ncbi:hypothetical protein QWZ14_11150 [Paeniroseomonas aquatica]|uniref:Uncharacterized protein n=1 Tax=Paeniroseomonas aquatica TaxID=373043 RepID=A0ABT8A5F5_9PROT|nr:hypothetical protein [Paeniroseomonas aquatica]MDN3564918.1 hypothetical protein [Paeniroseomonas aquatica]
MRPHPILGALLGLLAGCDTYRAATRCSPVEARLENASGAAVEQLYLAPAGADWGADLIGPDFLGRGELPSGGIAPLPFPDAGPFALRVVWADGRAAEMQGLDGCAIQRVTLLPAGLRAE